MKIGLLKAMFPDPPYIARLGQINAWDNEDFVKAIKATGEKQLIIAGVSPKCRVFSALEEGLGALFSNHIADYRNLLTRYTTIQSR